MSGSTLRCATRISRIRWAVMILSVIAVVAARAEATSTGSIHGKVVDGAGQALEGARVMLLAPRGSQVQIAHTDRNGTFSFGDLLAADYVVLIEKDGFGRLSRSVRLEPGSITKLTFVLAPESASKSEIDELRAEVARLRSIVDALLRERQSASPSGVEDPPLLAATTAANQRARIEADGAKSEPAAERPQQSHAEQGAQQEKQLPGRGRTEQGLYGSVAAGGAGTRYGRSLFGENVRIGGYGSFRFEANNLDRRRVGDLPVARPSANGFTFRRLVLTTDVTPSDRLRFYTELELERLGKIEIGRAAVPENRGGRNRLPGTRFIQELEGQGGSEIKLEQFWVQYNLGESLGLRGGIILPPLGRFNILHDDDYWDIPRRTLVDRDAPVIPAKSAWSEAGLGVIGSRPMGKGFFNYQFYVVNGVTLDFALEQIVSVRGGDKTLIEFEPEIFFDSGPVNGSHPAQALTWRLGFVPRFGNEIALSGYHGKYTPGFLSESAWINSLGLDGKLTRGGFEVEGEFIYSDYGKMQRVLGDLVRNVVNRTSEDELDETETEVAVGLAGPFAQQRYGFWFDVKYRWRPEWLRSSILGESFNDPQLIPIVRYERVWFNKFVRGLDFADGRIRRFDVEDLSQDRLTIGLTYRPVTSVPISFAYEHNRRRSGSTLIFPRLPGLGRPADHSFDAFVIGIALGF